MDFFLNQIICAEPLRSQLAGKEIQPERQGGEKKKVPGQFNSKRQSTTQFYTIFNTYSNDYTWKQSVTIYKCTSDW